jgi:hypothetical protein
MLNLTIYCLNIPRHTIKDKNTNVSMKNVIEHKIHNT